MLVMTGEKGENKTGDKNRKITDTIIVYQIHSIPPLQHEHV